MTTMGFRDNGLSWRRTAAARFAEYPAVRRARADDPAAAAPQPA
jgi:hypothetical protein